MKTLEEHNNIRWNDFNVMQELMKPHANGIACPICGKELWDSNPMITLASYPPQKNVQCPECGYVGYRMC